MHKIILILLFITFSLFSESKRVLIINSYQYGLSWTDRINRQIINKLPVSSDIIYEFMDSKRFHSDEYFEKLKNVYQFKYDSYSIDLIIVTDNDAYNFILKYADELFHDTPVVFCGVNYFNHEDIKGRNITGIQEDVVVSETLKIALDQNPNISSVYVVTDNTTSGLLFKKLFEESAETYDLKLPVYYLNDFSFTDIIEIVSDLSGSIIFNFPFTKDGNGKPVDFDKGTEMIISMASVPAYTFWSMYVDYGAVGGFVVSPENQGLEAGKLALEILEGKRASDIEVVNDSFNKYYFNYAALKKFNIRLKNQSYYAELTNLPVKLRESNPYLYNSLIVIFILLMLLFSLLIFISIRIKYENMNLEKKVGERSKIIEKQQRHLLESEKMASLGSLVSGVAHEINTPLGVGVTTASYMENINSEYRKKYDNGAMTKKDLTDFMSKLEESLSILNNNLYRASDLVNSFKKIAVDQTSENPMNFNLFEYINIIIKSLKHEYKSKNHKFTVDCPSDLFIYSYPGAVSQILTNLIMNSIIHGFKGLTDMEIIIKAEVSGDKLTIIYKDNGTGISDDILHRIYEPFFTTNRANGGSGLGMNIVFNLVTHRLHGVIHCNSKKNSGTEFIIEFPINKHGG